MQSILLITDYLSDKEMLHLSTSVRPITSIKEEKVLFSAVDCSLVCGFCSEGLPLPLFAWDIIDIDVLFVFVFRCCFFTTMTFELSPDV